MGIESQNLIFTEQTTAFFSAICIQTPEISAIQITYFQVSFVDTSVYKPKSHSILVAIQTNSSDSFFIFVYHSIPVSQRIFIVLETHWV